MPLELGSHRFNQLDAADARDVLELIDDDDHLLPTELGDLLGEFENLIDLVLPWPGTSKFDTYLAIFRHDHPETCPLDRLQEGGGEPSHLAERVPCDLFRELLQELVEPGDSIRVEIDEDVIIIVPSHELRQERRLSHLPVRVDDGALAVANAHSEVSDFGLSADEIGSCDDGTVHEWILHIVHAP